MNRIKPYRGLSKDRLSSLIRKSQIPQLPEALKFDFTPVEPGQEERNSQCVAAPTDHNGECEFGQRQIHWDRLDLEGLKGLPQGELVPYENMTFPTTTHAILPQVNAALGLNLTAEEVVDEPIAYIPVNGLTISVKAGSYAWVPGTHHFGYAPGATTQAAVATNLRIPRDERKRIRLKELVS